MNRFKVEGSICVDFLLNLDVGFESFEMFKEEIFGRLDVLVDIRDSECVFGVD